MGKKGSFLLGLCCMLWLFVSFVGTGSLVGCQHDLSLLTDGVASVDGGGGKEGVQEKASQETSRPDEAQNKETLVEEGVACSGSIACFHCSVEVGADERITTISERLLLLRSQDRVALVELASCHRRELEQKEGFTWEAGSPRSNISVVTVRNLLLASLPRSTQTTSNFFQDLYRWEELDLSRVYTAPAGTSWRYRTEIFEQERGVLQAHSKTNQDISLFHFNNKTGEISKSLDLGKDWAFSSQALSPTDQQDVLFFASDSRVVLAASFDLKARKVLSQVEMPAVWAWSVALGKTRILAGETSIDAQKKEFSVLKLVDYARFAEPILTIPLPRRVSLSFPAWYDPIERVFWLVLENKAWVISEETAKVQELDMPGNPQVAQWLGARYGRLWAISRDGEIGDFSVEAGNIRWRSLKTIQGLTMVGTCNARSEKSEGERPYFHVFRGGQTADGKVELWSMLYGQDGGKLIPSGKIISPAIMGRLTEFFQCGERGFLYSSDDGKQFETVAGYLGAERPFWESGHTAFWQSSSWAGQGIFQRLSVFPLEDQRDSSLKAMRWQLLDFARGVTQEETTTIDPNLFTAWATANDNFVVLREVSSDGKHHLKILRVR
ncbi:MAG: hypothetical protein H6728_16175 [Myxococcales bacterium]|nr:hypothetical protein [Myxococcales bacterium]